MFGFGKKKTKQIPKDHKIMPIFFSQEEYEEMVAYCHKIGWGINPLDEKFTMDEQWTNYYLLYRIVNGDLFLKIKEKIHFVRVKFADFKNYCEINHIDISKESTDTTFHDPVALVEYAKTITKGPSKTKTFQEWFDQEMKIVKQEREQEEIAAILENLNDNQKRAVYEKSHEFMHMLQELLMINFCLDDIKDGDRIDLTLAVFPNYWHTDDDDENCKCPQCDNYLNINYYNWSVRCREVEENGRIIKEVIVCDNLDTIKQQMIRALIIGGFVIATGSNINKLEESKVIMHYLFPCWGRIHEMKDTETINVLPLLFDDAPIDSKHLLSFYLPDEQEFHTHIEIGNKGEFIVELPAAIAAMQHRMMTGDNYGSFEIKTFLSEKGKFTDQKKQIRQVVTKGRDMTFLTEAETFGACTLNVLGEPLPPEPDVEYCGYWDENNLVN